MSLHFAMLLIGALLLAGLAADTLGRHMHVPRVTLLMLIGVALGPSAADLIPPQMAVWREFLATVALTMVAFLLGGRLTLGALRAHGREILVLSLAVVLASLALVAGGLILIGAPPALALIFGAVACATDPAATQDVVRQMGARGPFADRLLAIVAIDDGWGLIVFALVLVAAGWLTGQDGAEAVLIAAHEIGGALVIGLGVGLPSALLTGRLRPGEPMQLEAVGVVFLCAGLSLWAGASFLLAGMIAGMTVANLARHHDRAFHEIENVEQPFLVVFFLLAGAALQLGALAAVNVIAPAYLAARLAGRVLGGALGARPAGLPLRAGLWTGAALAPQAGVAVGMALVAAERFPQWETTILAVTVASTVVFEVFGPFLTRLALARGAPPRA